MKLQRILSTLLVLAFSVSVFSQLNTAYFQTLQSQKVNSSNKVEWVQIGPGMAGYCEGFWAHPTDPNSFFMSPDMGNSYGSWDNGVSYKTIKDDDGNGQELQRIQSIAFSHQNANFGLAADKKGNIFKTTNRGRTWQQVFSAGGRHSELAVDPNNDNVWYLGAGDFWDIKFNHRKKSNTLGYVYPYAKYGYIYKSTNKGQTWTKKTSGLPSTLDVGRIIVNPKNSNVVIAATNSGIYRSTDGGNTWASSSSGLPNNVPRDMDYYYNSTTGEFILYVVEQTFYIKNGNTVTARGGVYKSTNTGRTWTNMSGNLAIDLTKINYYTARDKYYRAIAFWFGISKDQAKTTYSQLPTSIFSVFNRIRVNPKNKNEVYIGHNVKHDYAFPPGDVWMTKDGGTKWIAAARSGKYWKDEKDKAYWQGRGNPIGMNTKYAHLHSEMEHKDEVQGNRFLETNANGHAFICIDQQTLRSNNHGTSWEQVDDFETSSGSKKWVGRGNSNLPGRFIIFGNSTNRHLFCSGEHGLWKQKGAGGYSDPNAVAMEQIDGQSTGGYTSTSTAAIHPNNPNIIYSLMFRQTGRGWLRKSTNGGASWTDVHKVIDYDKNISLGRIFQYSLLIDYNNTNNIYFCVPSNPEFYEVNAVLPSDFNKTGVYRTTNGGTSWTILERSNGLPQGASVRRLAMHPATPTTLYAALNRQTNGNAGGLYKTTNKGNNWTKVTIPSAIKAVNDVFIDKQSSAIYIACGHKNANVSQGGVWKSTNGGSSWIKIFEMPFVTQVATSPLDSKIITVAVGYASGSSVKINPGAYLSQDGGSNWLKINKNLGQPDRVLDLKPDPFDKKVLWCALTGSGWAKAIIEGGSSEPSTDVIISMESVGSGKIVSAENPNQMTCNKTSVGATEKFTMEDLGSGLYAFKGSNGKYVSSENGTKTMTCNRTSPGAWEKFTLVEISTDVYALKGSNDANVRANMKCTHTGTPGTWQQFKFTSYSLRSTSLALDTENDQKEAELLIYPNPAIGVVNIEFGTTTKAKVSIFNTQGKQVYNARVNEPKMQLSLDNFEKGIYLVKLETENNNLVKKLIVK